MKYINYPVGAIEAAWQARAETAASTAAQMSVEAAKAYITSRSEIWSDLKPALEALSSGKCWYSEARDRVSFWHVDHYRPKSLYPWLAFDWSNMRLCGGMPNVAKSNDFPLKDETTRATGASPSTALEFPLLLDPTLWGDPDLLTFNGAGEPTCADPRDQVAALRVNLSVKLLNLDTEKLCEGRRATWRSCERRLKDLRGIVEAQRHQNNTDAGDRLKDLCRDLDLLYNEESEFTATAWACAKELNAEKIVRLAKEVARSLD